MSNNNSYLPSEIANAVDSYKKEEKKYKDFYFDETTGKLSGQVVEGVEALKGWIYFALRISRYRYPIYSWNYGCELETIISNTYDDEYLESEVKRFIEEALLINPYILEVSDVSVNKENDKINVSCKVETKYGDLYVNV